MEQDQVIITTEIAERDKTANNFHHINRITLYLFDKFFYFKYSIYRINSF